MNFFSARDGEHFNVSVLHPPLYNEGNRGVAISLGCSISSSFMEQAAAEVHKWWAIYYFEVPIVPCR